MRSAFRALLLVLISLLLSGGVAFAEESPDPGPKYIFIFIGDGMGFNHVSAASHYFTGQQTGFAWQRFEYQLAMSTYHTNCTYDDRQAWSDFNYANFQYTDSAAAASAMSTGRKHYYTAVATSGQSDRKHLMEYAEEQGMSTGVVTSVTISHATPAGFVAHNQNRYNYEQIAKEMFESTTDVIMGCGHPDYDQNGHPRLFKKEYKYVGGESIWNLVKSGQYGYFIESRAQFQRLSKGKTPGKVIGIPRVAGTLQQERGFSDPYASEKPYRDPLIETVPTLAEMTAAAINVLDNNSRGFVVMIEGGAIDWASHGNQKDRMIEEMGQFDEAIGSAMKWVAENSNWNETLIIITADHETGYLTVSEGASAANPLIGNGLRELPEMHFNSGSHTNHLVPFYAKGRGAELFKKAAGKTDAVRGWYLDNTGMGQAIITLISK